MTSQVGQSDSNPSSLQIVYNEYNCQLHNNNNNNNNNIVMPRWTEIYMIVAIAPIDIGLMFLRDTQQ